LITESVEKNPWGWIEAFINLRAAATDHFPSFLFKTKQRLSGSRHRWANTVGWVCASPTQLCRHAPPGNRLRAHQEKTGNTKAPFIRIQKLN
jgi:hypothetical protein